MSLGVEADHGEIVAWAHEMRAWINLTTGDYHGVIAAARNGTQVTAHDSVAVQLFAQEAKAWARMGDRRQTEVAPGKGRTLPGTLPYPENLDHHFVVDPMKFDYAPARLASGAGWLARKATTGAAENPGQSRSRGGFDTGTPRGGSIGLTGPT